MTAFLLAVFIQGHLCWCFSPHEKCAYFIDFVDHNGQPTGHADIWGASTGLGCSTGNFHDTWKFTGDQFDDACEKVRTDLCAHLGEQIGQDHSGQPDN